MADLQAQIAAQDAKDGKKSEDTLARKAMNDAIGFDPTLSEEERGLWFEAYDADAEPSPLHLFGPSATAPAAFVGVQQIPQAARGHEVGTTTGRRGSIRLESSGRSRLRSALLRESSIVKDGCLLC